MRRPSSRTTTGTGWTWAWAGASDVRRVRGLSFSLLVPVAGLHAPAPAFAVDYLTPEQAQARMFPGASFELREVALTPEQAGALSARLGGPLRHAPLTLRLARGPGGLLGVMVVDDVVGKFERIT